MFSRNDVENILQLLTPPASNGTDHSVGNSNDETTFFYEQDGQHILLQQAARSKLKALVDQRHAINIQDLQEFLNLRDISSLVQWANSQESFSTPQVRRPDLPPWIQKVIAIHAYNELDRTFVNFESLADYWSVSVSTLHMILQAYSSTFYKFTTVGEYHCSPSLLSKVKHHLDDLCEKTLASKRPLRVNLPARNISSQHVRALLAQLQAANPRIKSLEIVAQDTELWLTAQGDLIRDKLARRDMVLLNLINHRQKGYCMIAEHDILGCDSEDLKIESSTNPDDKIIRLQKADCVKDLWPATGHTLAFTTAGYLQQGMDDISKALPTVAQSTWKSTQDANNHMDLQARQAILGALPDSILTELITYSSALDVLSSIYADNLSALATRASVTINENVMNHILVPINLYMASLSQVTSDDVLHDHQETTILLHLHSHVANLFASAFPSIPIDTTSDDARQQPSYLAPPRSSAVELTRFRTSAAASKSLPELTTAMKRLVRKLRIGDIPSEKLVGVWESNLSELVQSIMKTKRASDLLQRSTWALLSCRLGIQGGLWTGSGKDAGRLVKLLGRLAAGTRTAGPEGIVEDSGQEENAFDEDEKGNGFAWTTAAATMADFRDKVMAGKQTDDDMRTVKALVQQAYKIRGLSPP